MDLEQEFVPSDFFFFLSINIHRLEVIQLCVIHLFESVEFTIRGYEARFKFEKALTPLKEKHKRVKVAREEI